MRTGSGRLTPSPDRRLDDRNELGHPRQQSATEDEDRRVECVDNADDAVGEVPFRLSNDSLCEGIARSMRVEHSLSGDRRRAARTLYEVCTCGWIHPHGLLRAFRDRPTPGVRLKAPPVRTMTTPPSRDDRYVAHLPESVSSTLQEPATDHGGSADAGSEKQTEQVPGPTTGTMLPFRDRCCPSIIDHRDTQSELFPHTAGERHVAPSEVRGVDYGAGAGVNLGCDGHSRRHRRDGRLFEAGSRAPDQGPDHAVRAVVLMDLAAAVVNDRPVGRDESAHDLRRTEIDSEDKLREIRSK